MKAELNGFFRRLKKVIRGKKSAEAGIAVMTSLADVATANNTVSILIVGNVAKELSQEYDVDKKRTASLLDILPVYFRDSCHTVPRFCLPVQCSRILTARSGNFALLVSVYCGSICPNFYIHGR